MRRRSILVAVPVAAFIVGILAQLVSDKFSSSLVNTSTRITIVTLVGLCLVVVILVVVITFDYAERVNQINDVAGAVERLSLQFGISVEFVADYPGENDGMTYERTRQLISSAQHSLVFVDYWTETANYREGEE